MSILSWFREEKAEAKLEEERKVLRDAWTEELRKSIHAIVDGYESKRKDIFAYGIKGEGIFASEEIGEHYWKIQTREVPLFDCSMFMIDKESIVVKLLYSPRAEQAILFAMNFPEEITSATELVKLLGKRFGMPEHRIEWCDNKLRMLAYSMLETRHNKISWKN